MHVTQAALDEVAYAHRAPRVEQLVWPHGDVDPVVHQLGQTLLSSLEHPHHTSKIFLDHVLQALNCHFVCTYGGVTISARAISGWTLSLADAKSNRVIGGSSGRQHYPPAGCRSMRIISKPLCRAFKQTFRKPPYKWLMERRVDRARDLMTNSRLPLADIAARCGFADQSALNRSFKRIHGLAPGIWRRRRARTTIDLHSLGPGTLARVRNPHDSSSYSSCEIARYLGGLLFATSSTYSAGMARF